MTMLLWLAAGVARADETVCGLKISKQKPSVDNKILLPRCKARCEARDAASCVRLGDALYEGGLDRAGAFKFYMQACTLRSMVGCRKSGMMMINDDPPEGLKLLERACKGRDLLACVSFGEQLEQGQNLAQDFDRANALYAKACEGGEPDGCAALGALLADGTGVAKNEAKAATLFQRACTGGSPNGCTNLAVFYKRGRGGLPLDLSKAHELFTKACGLGSQFACDAAGRDAAP